MTPPAGAITPVVYTGVRKGKGDPMKTTKSQVRSDFAYARHLMRLAEPALRADDLDELQVLALELAAAATTLSQYVIDREERETL